jgi:hypothetical protein
VIPSGESCFEVNMSPGLRQTLSRKGWLTAILLIASYIAAVTWPQKSVWATECPGQIWFTCHGQLIHIVQPSMIQAIVCLVFSILGVLLLGVVDLGLVLEKLDGFFRQWATAAMICVVVASVALPLIVAWFVLDRFPNSGDEYSYLFEAQTLAHFRLWEKAPILGEDLIPWRTWIFEQKWISQYPPGWPFVLSLGLIVGLPAWAMNSLLGGVSIAALGALCHRIAGYKATAIALALYASTPFYIMNAASYFSHMLSSLLLVALCLCLWKTSDKPAERNLIAAGFLLGAIGLTRYLDLPLLAPALLFWLFRLRATDWPRVVGLMTLGFLPLFALLLIYQALVAGSPLQSTYSLMNAEDTHASIALDSLVYGMQLSTERIAELALWTCPSVLFTYGLCLYLKLKNRSLQFYDLIFPSFVAGYCVFAQLGVNRYGPRYYFEAFPFLLLTILSALPLLKARLSEPSWRAFSVVLPIFSLFYILVGWPWVATGFHREVTTREEPFRLVGDRRLTNAVVVLDTASGRGLSKADLVRNSPSMDAEVIYARAEASLPALRDAFPDRSIWRYSRPDFERPGQLVRVAP